MYPQETTVIAGPFRVSLFIYLDWVWTRVWARAYTGFGLGFRLGFGLGFGLRVWAVVLTWVQGSVWTRVWASAWEGLG